MGKTNHLQIVKLKFNQNFVLFYLPEVKA